MNKKAIVALLAVVAVVVIGALVYNSSGSSVPTPEIGRVYQVMLYQEDIKVQVRQANGSMTEQARRVVGVHFVGRDHSNRPPQYVPADFVKRVTDDPRLPTGTGRWVVITHPTLEGIDYGWHTEFQFNGELGTQPRVPAGGTPRS